MTARYAIQGPTIFYLYDVSEQPYPEGVFEAEKVIEDAPTGTPTHYVNGPIRMTASQRFFNVYQLDKFVSHITILQRPDTAHEVILNDPFAWLDLSSYLDDGKILMKVRRRFMVFSCDGAFLSEVTFSDADSGPPEEEDVDGPSRKEMSLRKFRKEQQAMKPFEAGMSPIARL